jgi:catechol 2,3-dioxygenase-like lactoylglutathione lyase family enzyme
MTFDHLAIAVTELERAVRLFEAFGYRQLDQFRIAGTVLARLQQGESRIGLAHGASRRSDIALHVAAYGPGPHHIAFRVADLDHETEKLGSLFGLEGLTVEDGHGRQWTSRREPVTGLIFELIEKP